MADATVREDMTIQTAINVIITNLNCAEAGTPMVLDVNNNTLIINTPSNAQTQIWTLIPNLIPTNAASGGFTLYNSSANGSAEQPAGGSQISLGDDPTPYGSAAYCWTLWPAGGQQLWAIQDSQRGLCMDASGGSCDAGTPVLFWGWNGGDNQKWIIVKQP
jgi:Ricin-type beta-trefoil lectin domain-like